MTLRIKTILLICSLVLGNKTLWAARAELVFEGNLIQKTDFISIKGTDYLPLKSVANLFRGKTQRLPVSNKVILQLNNQKITFTVNSLTVMIGNKKTATTAAIRMHQGTIVAPVSFFLYPEFDEESD